MMVIIIMVSVMMTLMVLVLNDGDDHNGVSNDDPDGIGPKLW